MKMKNEIIQVSRKMVEDAVVKMNNTASDKSLTAIERKVKIANDLSGEYLTICGNSVIVYRSPNNRTLLAMKGDIFGKGVIKIDLLPTQALTHLMSY